MTSLHYVIPENSKPAFNCPHCGAYAQQKHYLCKAQSDTQSEAIALKNPLEKIISHPNIEGYTGEIKCTECLACGFVALWIDSKLIFPDYPKELPKPNEDLPEDIRDIYKEAAMISVKSPRSSAALLRLCLEKLLIHLNINGDNLNQRIENSKFPDKILNACDSVRVHGNNALHPGEINIDDNADVISTLFRLINYIADNQITLPNKVDDIFEGLPESSKLQIKKRKKEE